MYVAPDELTPRQDRLARQYVKTGNKTKAGKLAGYAPASAHVTAHNTLKLPKVAKAVALYRKRMAERIDVTAEKVVQDIAHLTEDAGIKGDIGNALKGNDMLASILGLKVEKRMTLNVDLTAAHLEALRGLARGRITDVDADDV